MQLALVWYLCLFNEQRFNNKKLYCENEIPLRLKS